ncbi:sulfate reduction electron transfer complex DsrMKJOP subunit DsrO [Acetonema longum]|uniref:4Fe-4S ferredoxin iron-sulfur binding domain-containing protein n=1 Tax=Acetonema longum DSM 6540 TaxID=1009370 RepID=F7NFF5_9FIRM|nr:4Fe-4S dicluster domain-containing protein [Acetonema longum]EGO65210.1 4Fe-4S ferredoxin iron-sulfur binding domain-containing protein [Acetonema longum DSM 6540]
MSSMKLSRKEFLRLSGLCLAGLGALPLVRGWAQGDQTAGPAAKRWAMAVDTSKCRPGCTDCMLACHSLHNVPQIPNANHEVKWIWPEGYDRAFAGETHDCMNAQTKQRQVIVLCNHCDNPACVRVCPTQATFKRADGIVMMDYHRCTGCRYCMAACPYGARSFNFVEPRQYLAEIRGSYPTRTKGVVEKCNFCSERLAVGLMPACVEACKHQALIFGDRNDPDSPLRQVLQDKYSIRRKEKLGAQPNVFYLV